MTRAHALLWLVPLAAGGCGPNKLFDEPAGGTGTPSAAASRSYVGQWSKVHVEIGGVARSTAEAACPGAVTLEAGGSGAWSEHCSNAHWPWDSWPADQMVMQGSVEWAGKLGKMLPGWWPPNDPIEAQKTPGWGGRPDSIRRWTDDVMGVSMQCAPDYAVWNPWTVAENAPGGTLALTSLSVHSCASPSGPPITVRLTITFTGSHVEGWPHPAPKPTH